MLSSWPRRSGDAQWRWVLPFSPRWSGGVLWRWGRWALLSLCCLVGAAIPGDAGARGEGEDAKARAAIERIRKSESDVLAELERAEAEVEEAKRRAAAVGEEARAAAEAATEAQQEEARAAKELADLEAALGDRLRLRYRTLRQSELAAFLAADTPAAFGRNRRALDRILERDLASLREVRAAREELALRSQALEEIQLHAAERAEEAQMALAAAEGLMASREALLGSLRSERSLHERTAAALAKARAQLVERLQEMEPADDPAVPGSFASLKGALPMPVEGAIVEVLFGKTVNARFKTVVVQNGLDLRAALGSEVRAVAPAKVIFADWFRAYGNLVILDHGEGYHSLYGHLDSISVEVGREVEAGALLGRVGESASLKGAYLYFELRERGKPIDPMGWLGRR